ncbi:MAG: ArsA family ATPase [Chloroflexi bacterium]|nr:ArsA family ATPase [Chloroflexota bacterium]MBM4452712.1 ArsA family ATPase [Chloroflexota bacterium]MBM4453517.1 ArsA family ATPase [Chloroflexota bacterium]
MPDNYACRNDERRVVMFAGKGGVGKTTCAAATALHHALLGRRTLIVSTDPTPSLSHIFEVGRTPRANKVPQNLRVEEIGVDRVKQMWDEKFGREVYEVFSSFVDIGYEEFVEFVTEVLPGMRDEFMVDYIRELALKAEYEKVVWDTAPLGQTLGLLNMPSMLGKHLKTAPRIYSRLKLGADSRRSVLDIIKGWEELSGTDMEFLRHQVEFVIVTIPEALAVEQLDDIFAEFDKHQLMIGRLVVNNVIKDTSSEFLVTKARQQREYIDLLQSRYPDLEKVELPMFPREIKGIDRLKDVGKSLFQNGE